MKFLEVIRKERRMVIRLVNLAKRNTLNPQLIIELKKVFEKVKDDKFINLVTITGVHTVFSAGADLAHLQKISENNYEENQKDVELLKELFCSIYYCPKPVIACVNGHAIAGGAGLASVCDIILMKASAKIGYTEVKIGFVAALVMVFLRKIVGDKKCRDILFSGRLLPAEEAKEIGLATHVFPDEDFDKECEKYLSEIEKNAPQSLITTKKLLNEIEGMPLKKSLLLASKVNIEARFSANCKEGIASFLEKRDPVW